MEDMDVIQRVRVEHERLREITRALEEAMSAPAWCDREVWLKNLRSSYEHFRAHLIHRIALKEIGGFLQVVVERRPTLTAAVENLKKDHAQVITRAGEVWTQLRTMDGDSQKDIDAIILEIKMVLAEVHYHEEAENLLVGSALTEDIGVGD